MLPEGDDIIEVPTPASGIADDFMDLRDCLPLVIARFASSGQTLCIPTLTDNCGAVVAALAAGCTVIAADEDQAVIDDVVRRVSEHAESASIDLGKLVSGWVRPLQRRMKDWRDIMKDWRDI